MNAAWVTTRPVLACGANGAVFARCDVTERGGLAESPSESEDDGIEEVGDRGDSCSGRTGRGWLKFGPRSAGRPPLVTDIIGRRGSRGLGGAMGRAGWLLCPPRLCPPKRGNAVVGVCGGDDGPTLRGIFKLGVVGRIFFLEICRPRQDLVWCQQRFSLSGANSKSKMVPPMPFFLSIWCNRRGVIMAGKKGGV